MSIKEFIKGVPEVFGVLFDNIWTMVILPNLKYLSYVMRHKWFVFLACCRLAVKYREPRLIWRGLIHDLSKFRPSEWFPYVNYFNRTFPSANSDEVRLAYRLGFDPKTKEDVQMAFDDAWNYHQKRNNHHWQYWLLTPDNPRPNFSFQSHDGGMTHSEIRSLKRSADVAIIYNVAIEWWKPDFEAVKELQRDIDNTPIPLEMPFVCCLEMIADWRGAGRALGNPNTQKWYLANRDKMVLHEYTRYMVECELGV